MKQLFIIGGSGLVGTDVIKEFIRDGWGITSLTRSGKSILGEKVLKGDRKDKNLLSKIFEENTFDLVIDMIPFNLEDIKILVNILTKYKTSLIICSSIDVYKANALLWKTEELTSYQKCPIKESDELREKLSIEGKNYNKLGIEKLYLSLPGSVAIIRLPAIYGYPDFSRTEQYLEQIFKNKDVYIQKEKINWKFSRGYNKNCAYSIFLAKDKKGKNIYNVAEENTYTEEEWIIAIGKFLNWKGKVIGKDNIEPKLDFKQNWYVDSSKIRSELGFYEKYDVLEGLYDNILHYIHKKNNITYIKNY